MGNEQGLFGKRKRKVNIVIEGLYNSGKTTILNKLNLGEVITTYPTIGFNVETVEHKHVSVKSWDVGGRDKVRPLFRHYYRHTDIVLFVVDSADQTDMDIAKREMYRTLEDYDLVNCKAAVLANKQDLLWAMPVLEVAEKLGVFNRNRRHGLIPVFPISATTGDGLSEVLKWIEECDREGDSKRSENYGGKTDLCSKCESGFVDKLLTKMKSILVD